MHLRLRRLPSRAAAGTAYVTFDGHRGGDYSTYVFTTTDFGATWRSIVSNLPKGEVARAIAEDRKNADLLYLGTETGLWVSWNRGGQWTRLKANLPTMPVYEIKTHPRDNDMILAVARARHLDSRRPRHHPAVGEERGRGRAFAFEPEPAAPSTCQRSDEGLRGRPAVPGHEPGAGATLAYRLKADAKDVKWIDPRRQRQRCPRDHRRRDERTATRRGLNIVKWDLRVAAAAPLPPAPARHRRSPAVVVEGLRRDEQRAVRSARHLSRGALR